MAHLHCFFFFYVQLSPLPTTLFLTPHTLDCGPAHQNQIEKSQYTSTGFFVLFFGFWFFLFLFFWSPSCPFQILINWHSRAEVEGVREGREVEASCRFPSIDKGAGRRQVGDVPCWSCFHRTAGIEQGFSAGTFGVWGMCKYFVVIAGLLVCIRHCLSLSHMHLLSLSLKLSLHCILLQLVAH